MLFILDGFTKLYTIVGASASTIIFLITSLSFPALSFTLYVTFFVPVIDVSILLGSIIISPSIPDNESFAVTFSFKFTTSFFWTTLSPIPSIFGIVLSNFITSHFFSLLPKLLLAIAHI